MVRTANVGGAQSVSATDFNERVKRLLADKPESAKPVLKSKSNNRGPRVGPKT